MYRIVKFTDISLLTKKDMTNLNLAINEAEQSCFHQSRQIGSVLEYGSCKLYGPQRA
jgi:hypothetical protein